MRVLIKGLKLPPVGIRQCIVSFADNCLLITDVCGKILFEGEYVEVPTPHGRLIDEEAIYNNVKSRCNNCHIRICAICGVTRILNDIRTAPTIIKAEGVNE